MSRYINTVFAQHAAEVFCTPVEELPVIEIDGQQWVNVAHGYDAPCCAYFCDLMPDCEVGIWYGVIGMGKRLDKSGYLKAMKTLQLQVAASSVAFDIPY